MLMRVLRTTASLAAATSALAAFETRIAAPAAVSTFFTLFVAAVVFIMAFRPAHRAPADAADASPLAAAVGPALPLSVDDTEPGLETASVAPRDSDSPTAASTFCILSVAVVVGVVTAAASLAAATSALDAFETRIVAPAAVSTFVTLFVTATVFITAFRPAHSAPADATDASSFAAALAPALPLSVDDADPGLETASVAPRDSGSPTAASAFCVPSVAVVGGVVTAAASLAAALPDDGDGDDAERRGCSEGVGVAGSVTLAVSRPGLASSTDKGRAGARAAARGEASTASAGARCVGRKGIMKTTAATNRVKKVETVAGAVIRVSKACTSTQAPTVPHGSHA